MNYADFEVILQYGHLTGLLLSAYALYSYIWYMYKNDKQGKTNYEKLAYLALDDDINSKPLNEVKKQNKKNRTTL